MPSQKQDKGQKFKFWNFAKALHGTHFLKLLDKMYEYEMDPSRTVGATEQTRDVGRMDGRTDGVKPIYPPHNYIVQEYNNSSMC